MIKSISKDFSITEHLYWFPYFDGEEEGDDGVDDDEDAGDVEVIKGQGVGQVLEVLGKINKFTNIAWFTIFNFDKMVVKGFGVVCKFTIKPITSHLNDCFN